MGTKTVGLREEVYERLAAEKREGESFSDAVDRILDATQSDWRYSFGRMSDDAEEFKEVVRTQRRDMNEGLANRQNEVIEELVATADESGSETE